MMTMIREELIKSHIIQKIYFGLYVDFLRELPALKSKTEKAIKVFVPKRKLNDKRYISSLKKDIFLSYLLTMAHPDEYFLYGFEKKTQGERKKFLTDMQLNRILHQEGGVNLYMTRENYPIRSHFANV